MTSTLAMINTAHQAMLKALCAALNHLLAAEPQAKQMLSAHRGKSVRLESAALPSLALALQEDDLFAPASAELAPSLSLQLDAPKAALLLAQGKDVAGAVKLSGDAEFAAAVGWLAANLRWEFEEDLAKLVGATGANQAGKLVRSIGAAIHQSAQGTEAMLKRGLAQERAPLVSSPAFEPLKAKMSEIRDAVARLEKRLELLEKKSINRFQAKQGAL